MNASILLVEDDKTLHEAIKSAVIDKAFIITSAYDGAGALRHLEKILPDLVILDLGLPDIQGESLCKQIHDKFPELPIIILTAKNTTADVVKGLNIGASDYISKPFSIDELVARIHARLRELKKDANTLKVDGLVLDGNKITVTRDGKPIKLTQKEFLLLEYFMVNSGRVLSREMILNHVWSYSPEIESRAVDVYVGYLRKKIDAGFKKPLINSIRGFGYVLKD